MMEDLYIYFNVDEMTPEGFAWMDDDYDILPKLAALQEKYTENPGALHNALLDVAASVVTKDLEHIPFAGILIAHVAAHAPSQATKKKLQNALEYLGDYLGDTKDADNLACCAFETYFCMARMMKRDAPFAQLIHENYWVATGRVMEIESEPLQEVVLAVARAPDHCSEKEIFFKFAHSIFEASALCMEAKSETKEEDLQDCLNMTQFAVNVSINLEADNDLIKPLTECFSHGWDKLYSCKHEAAGKFVQFYLSADIPLEKVNPVFHRIMMEKAERFFGEKPLLGPSYPLDFIKPDKVASSLAPRL